MTIIRPNSIAGITSLTALGTSIDFYDANGIGVDFNNVNLNNTSGVSTFSDAQVNTKLLIGSGTSTGTASQTLQVTGGAYVSGAIGIGVTSPDSGTVMHCSVDTNQDIRLGVSNQPVISYRNGSGAWFYAGKNDTNDYFEISSGASPSANSHLVVNSSGNLGIGTTNPSVVLDIATSTDAYIRATTTGTIQSSVLNLVGKQAGVDNQWNIVATGNGLSGPELRFVNGFWTGSPYMQIDTSGRVLKASQPYFYAIGANSNYTLTNGADLPFNNAITNIGNHFNTTNYRFTAPIAGRYLITWSVFVNNVAGRCTIKVNGLSYNNLQMDVGAGMSQSAILSLSANDYVTVGDWQSLSGMQVYMGHCHFSGILLS